MASIDWPSSAPTPMHFGIQPREQVVADPSPFTGAREVMHRWHQWHVIMTWNHLTHQNAHRLMAHFNGSRGGLGLFEIPIFSYRAKLGTKSGAVTLSGAHAAGVTSLTITGGAGAFAQGDWIHIVETAVPRAYLIKSDEVAGVITINPGLRSARAGGTVLQHFESVGDNLIRDTMELPPDPTFASAFPSPLPGLFQPFTIELVSALRRNP